MKILHTSDWHIGKKLYKCDREDEFRAVLEEIDGICEQRGVELCLIAGDIFDTYIPPAEAEEIFYSAIKKISDHSAVLIISGNHDDYVRLTAASALAEQSNVYIVGNNLRAVNCRKVGACYPVEAGAGYVIFENIRGERVYINVLPYPNEARFKEWLSDESFDDKMARWIETGERGKQGREKLPSIFLSHIFVAGGKCGESERQIDLGGARLVKKSLLPKCDYAALGHLHKRQDMGNIHYSGSIMRFAFDESGLEKSVNVFDLTKNGVENYDKVPLLSAKQLLRLQATSAEDGLALLEKYRDSYVELMLKLDKPLTKEQAAALRANKNLANLQVESEFTFAAQSPSRKNKTSEELFCDYYALRYNGSKPSGELLELFLSLTEEE